MAKKRGKSRASSKKIKGKNSKVEQELKPKESVNGTLHELEILAEEKKVESKIEDIGKKEYEIEKKEDIIAGEEKKIEQEAEKVEKLEKEIKREVTLKPLAKLTLKDVNKGIVGAFIGVVAHFAFLYGKELANQISTARATVLFVFSYILIIILMYETGYRQIKEKRFLWILPKRATAIYLVSLVMIPIIFFLFNQINLADPAGLYKQIAVTSVLSSVGAGTADLIGRE